MDKEKLDKVIEAIEKKILEEIEEDKKTHCFANPEMINALAELINARTPFDKAISAEGEEHPSQHRIHTAGQADPDNLSAPVGAKGVYRDLRMNFPLECIEASFQFQSKGKQNPEN